MLTSKFLCVTGPPTSPPTNLSVEMASMTTAFLTWNSLANYSTGGGEIRGLKLFFYEKGSANLDESVKKISTEPKIIFKNLELNTTYCVSLSAVNDFGEGPRSECIELNTPSGILCFLLLSELCFVESLLHLSIITEIKLNNVSRTAEGNSRFVFICPGLKRNDRMLRNSL